MPTRLIRQFIETERLFGVEELPKLMPRVKAELTSEKTVALASLYERHKMCLACSLGSTRTQLVFGAGSADARLMFVGEAPGHDEDACGLPFVGPAGQLLTKIIEAMKLGRDEVYIANCLKCRPPENRDPLPNEISTCNPILMEQIAIIRPAVLCALGKFSAQTLLATTEPISHLRGKFYDFHGIKLMPTFHPAYHLRNPADKKYVWNDMKKIMSELGIS